MAGNRTLETYATSAGTYEHATVVWDALNRMVSDTDTGGTMGDAATVTWQYDLNSNIRRMTSTAPSMDAYGTLTPGGTLEDYWYRYDDMNRFVSTQDTFDTTADQIYRAENGPSEDITYDAAGERVRVAMSTSHQVYDGDAGEWETIVKETDEIYTYTADGYLAQVNTVSGSSLGYYAGDPLIDRIPPAPTGTGTMEAAYVYDAMGRVTDYKEYDALGSNVYIRDAVYDSKSEVTSDVVTSVRSDGTYVSSTSYDYGAAVVSGGVTTYTGTYQGGDVAHSHTTTTKGGTAQPTTDTVNTYVWWDSAQQNVTTFNPDTSHTTINTSIYHYDDLGHISTVNITDGRPRTVTFVTDNDNEVIRRDEADSLSTGDPHEIHWYFNGTPVGDVTNNGTSNVDYAVSIGQHITTPGTGPFLNGSATSTSYADFDENYDPINGLNYDSTASSYTVQSGDTLESIASQLWGDSSYWYMIADANGLSDDSDLAAGMDLQIPNKIHNDANNASTYAVYDPNEALGNDSPTAPKVPKHHGGCGIVGQIIVAVVSVVVAAFAPELIPALAELGTIGSLAASAAIGSIVGQGVGLAIGAQSKFSFAQVAEAAISAGVGGEVGDVLGPATDFVSGVVRGVVGSVVTQGIEVATGLEKKFSWADVATAGVSAGVEGSLSDDDDIDDFSKGFVSGMAGDIAGSAVRTLSNGSDFGDNLIKGLPSVFSEAAGDEAQGLANPPPPPLPRSNNDVGEGNMVVNGNVVSTAPAPQQVTFPDGTVMEYTPPSALPDPLTEAVNPFEFKMPDGSVVDYTPPDALPTPMQVAVDPSKLPPTDPNAGKLLLADTAFDKNPLKPAAAQEGALSKLMDFFKPGWPKDGSGIILLNGQILSREGMELDLLKYETAMPSLTNQFFNILSHRGGDDPPDVGNAINDLLSSPTGEYYNEFPKDSPQKKEFDLYMRSGYLNVRPAPYDGMEQLQQKMVDEAFPKHG